MSQVFQYDFSRAEHWLPTNVQAPQWIDVTTGEIQVTTQQPTSWGTWENDDGEHTDWALAGDVGDISLAFVDFGGAWVELNSLESFWPTETGSMILVSGVAIPVTCSPQEIVEKMKHVLLQTQGGL